MKMKNKELIGYIGIDSGQVLIVDPCYLSNWKDDEYDDTRGIRKGNKTYLYRKDFETYEEPLKKENNKTPNELVKEGWESFSEYPKSGEFSYNGICQLTLSKNYGQLDNLSVGSSTGWGDGCYPVYGEIKHGRVVKLIIDFDTDEDETLDTLFTKEEIYDFPNGGRS
jgi:hypothetical protein|tara:strand:- start:1869 stop:2369 length:501 start_codon:yes stop_codon:yes gene_type:complete